MMPKALVFFLGAAMLVRVETGWSQRASNWRTYRMADGLPESGCVAVTIAPQGKILVKHLSSASVSELDGYNVNVIPAPEVVGSRVYESAGGQLWTVVAQGLQEFKDGSWVLHRVPEIATAFHVGIDPIPLCPVRHGLVIFLLTDRLMEFNSEDPDHPRTKVLHTVSQTRLEKFSSMTLPITRDGGLWIAGGRGLAQVPGPVRNLKPESEWREHLPPEELHIQNLAAPHEDQQGGVTVLAESSTNHEKLVVHFDGQNWTTQAANNERLRQAWRGPDGKFWAATIEALFQMDEGSAGLSENEEISARQYFDLATEPNGSFWLATSDGLFRYASPAWKAPKSVQRINSLIHCLTGDQQDRLWFISGGKLHALQNENHQEFPLPARLARNSQSPLAIYPLKNGTLLMEAGTGLFQFQPASGAFNALPGRDSRDKFKVLGLLKDGRPCVQRFDGNALEHNFRLEICDGVAFEPWSDPPSDSPIGPHLTALFAAQNGDLWVGGEHGTAWYHEKKWRTFTSNDKSLPEAALAFVELPEGKIWCATQDKIWEFDGRNWSAVRRGFDRVNGLLRSHDGSIWVASNNGLHRWFQNAWVENGLEEGLPSPTIRAIYEDQRGRTWVATTRGLSLFHPEADPDPPQTRIQNLPEKEHNVREGGTLHLTFTGQDKWKYTPRERLLYSYKLDAQEWSPFQELSAVSFTDLPSGKHYFQVRAMDRNCNVEPKPAQLEFAVIAPWYKEGRLVLISFAGVAVALFFAGLAFNRHRQLLLSYAEVEKKVAQRTEELEIANQELLHSQKMNALGTLAAGIAHDFNNILSIIKGSAQIIEDNLENPQKVRTRLDRIKTVVEQGAGIVKAMLGFSRDSDQQTGVCDVNAVVEDTLKLLGDRFVREVQVSFEPGAGLPQASASKDFVQQILLNFLFNATDAMTKRKQVVLATALVEKLPEGIALVPARAAAYVLISVRDSGSGILPENMPRIFEPFFTTKALSARRGTGLGLSMVYELAKKMEAGLAVESVLDQGSTFTLILPVLALDLATEPQNVKMTNVE
jgi:signal transduction histidine kinase